MEDEDSLLLLPLLLYPDVVVLDRGWGGKKSQTSYSPNYCKYQSLTPGKSAKLLLFVIHPKAGEPLQSENEQRWQFLQEGLGTSHTVDLKVYLKEGKGRVSKNMQQVGENKRSCYAKRRSLLQKEPELQEASQHFILSLQSVLSLCCVPFLHSHLSSVHRTKSIIVYWFISSQHKITAWSPRSSCVRCTSNSLAMAGVT